jgi:hypothetical protein
MQTGTLEATVIHVAEDGAKTKVEAVLNQVVRVWNIRVQAGTLLLTFINVDKKRRDFTLQIDAHGTQKDVVALPYGKPVAYEVSSAVSLVIELSWTIGDDDVRTLALLWTISP